MGLSTMWGVAGRIQKWGGKSMDCPDQGSLVREESLDFGCMAGRGFVGVSATPEKHLGMFLAK